VIVMGLSRSLQAVRIGVHVVNTCACVRIECMGDVRRLREK
jgi:hypothetical protein